jgi:hypothetical protein
MSDAKTVTLSTGHEVTLPLSTTATMVGGVFSAAVDAAEPLCPDGLAPVRVSPARTLVVLLGVDYHRIDENQLEPYDEFGIILPVARGDRPVSLPRALRRDVGGYVWQLPVTTEPARALGDIWQYPKSLAEIGFSDTEDGRRTTLAVDGQQRLTLDTCRPPTVSARLSAVNYTDGDGTVRREAVHLDGKLGVAPFGASVALEGGNHWTDQLRVLGVEGGALATLAFEGEFVIDPPRRLDGP